MELSINIDVVSSPEGLTKGDLRIIGEELLKTLNEQGIQAFLVLNQSESAYLDNVEDEED